MWSDGPAVGGGRHFVMLGAGATTRVSCPKPVESVENQANGKNSFTAWMFRTVSDASSKLEPSQTLCVTRTCHVVLGSSDGV